MRMAADLRPAARSTATAEPPYGDRVTRFGIDAPTFLRLARGDRRPHPSHQLVAPNSLRSRALELLLQEVLAGQLTDDEALQIHERMAELKVRPGLSAERMQPVGRP